jgi:hypothetical protein
MTSSKRLIIKPPTTIVPFDLIILPRVTELPFSPGLEFSGCEAESFIYNFDHLIFRPSKIATVFIPTEYLVKRVPAS